LRAAALAPIVLGAPPEFNGREGTWSPEQLFVASVNDCFMLTFLAIAENSKLALLCYSSTARGKLEKVQAGGYQITEILIQPTVVIEFAQDLSSWKTGKRSYGDDSKTELFRNLRLSSNKKRALYLETGSTSL
jgi:organic hydroperoxide reductase OsmC/OhrA